MKDTQEQLGQRPVLDTQGPVAAAAPISDEVEEDDDTNDEEEVEDEDQEPVVTAPRAPSSRRPPAPRARSRSAGPTPPRPDISRWRARRVLPNGKFDHELFWGCNGVEQCEWDLAELSYDEIRRRWGSGLYSIWWYGFNEEAQQWAGLGRSQPIRLLDTAPAQPAQSAPAIAAASPNPSNPMVDLIMTMIPALRSPAAGGGADLSALLLQMLTLMSRQQEHSLERERLAAKERIAQIEANAQMLVRNARGFDPASFATTFAEQIRDTLQETIEDALESIGGKAPAGPSEMMQLATMIRDMITPGITMLGQKLMADSANLPGPYRPGSGT